MYPEATSSKETRVLLIRPSVRNRIGVIEMMVFPRSASLFACLIPLTVQANEKTPAFTMLFSEAKATYSFGQLQYSNYSGTAGSLVQQVCGLNVTWESEKNLRSYRRNEQIDIWFTLTNTGNGRDCFLVGFGGNAKNWLVDERFPIYDENGGVDLTKPICLERNQQVELRLRLRVPYQKPFETGIGMDGYYATLSSYSLGCGDATIASTRWSQEIVLGREDLWGERGWGKVHDQAFWNTTVTAMGADQTGLYLGMSDKTMRVFRPSTEWVSYNIVDANQQGVELVGVPAISGNYIAARTVDGRLLVAPSSNPAEGGIYHPPGGSTVVSDPAPLPDGFAVVLSNQSMRKVFFTGGWGASLALPAKATTALQVHDGMVYVGLESGELLCTDSTMRLRWVSQLWQGPLQWLVPGSDRFLAFATTTRNIGVLDVGSRLPFWSRKVPSTIRGLCQADWGVYALCADRRVYGFHWVTGNGLTGFPTRELPGESGDLATGLVALARSEDAPTYIWGASRAPLGTSGQTTDASLLAFCGNLGINLYGIGRAPHHELEQVHAVLPPVVVPFNNGPLIAVAINGRFFPFYLTGENRSWVYLWRPNFGP